MSGEYADLEPQKIIELENYRYELTRYPDGSITITSIIEDKDYSPTGRSVTGGIKTGGNGSGGWWSVKTARAYKNSISMEVGFNIDYSGHPGGASIDRTYNLFIRTRSSKFYNEKINVYKYGKNAIAELTFLTSGKLGGTSEYYTVTITHTGRATVRSSF